MKRTISLILVILMLLSLCACGDEAGGKAGGDTAAFQVGFGRENVTPEAPVNLAGGGDPNRISTEVWDSLFVTCVAMTDPTGNTVLVITSDLQSVPSKGSGFTNDILNTAEKATGVPKENILLSATHSHSTPSQTKTRTGVSEFFNIFIKGVEYACRAAMEDRAPATMSAGQIKADGYVFTRHYKMMDGSYAGSSYGNLVPEQIVAHTYEADTTLQMVQFNREGKKSVLMMNLGAHATFNGSVNKTWVSADFPGPLRNHIEENSDCLVAYFMAPAGDQTPRSQFEKVDHGLEYKEYGQAVGKLVVDALPTLQSVNVGNINLKLFEYTGKTNYKDTDRLIEAKDVYNYYLENGYSKGTTYAKQNGFISVYDARSIVTRAKLPKTQQIELGAMTIGDVSFIFASFEMFGVTGRYIRENSPYDMTFICTQSLAQHDYIPSDIGFELNCYEAYTAHFEQDTAQNIADLYIQTLKEMKEA